MSARGKDARGMRRRRERVEASSIARARRPRVVVRGAPRGVRARRRRRERRARISAARRERVATTDAPPRRTRRARRARKRTTSDAWGALSSEDQDGCGANERGSKHVSIVALKRRCPFGYAKVQDWNPIRNSFCSFTIACATLADRTQRQLSLRARQRVPKPVGARGRKRGAASRRARASSTWSVRSGTVRRRAFARPRPALRPASAPRALLERLAPRARRRSRAPNRREKDPSLAAGKQQLARRWLAPRLRSPLTPLPAPPLVRERRRRTTPHKHPPSANVGALRGRTRTSFRVQ